MSEPRTQAGRDLLLHWPHHVWCASHAGDPCDCKGNLLGGILAIEAEALPTVERLAAALHVAFDHDAQPAMCLPSDRRDAAIILAFLQDEP